MKLRHLHFVILLVILALGVGMFFYTSGNKSLQVAVGIATAVFYMLWGIIHHLIEKDLHPRLVVEYVLIAAIAIVLLLTVAI